MAHLTEKLLACSSKMMADSTVTLPSDLERLTDPEMQSAYKASIQNSSLLPSIKLELKSKIQAKRHKDGLPEIQPDFSPPKKYKLSEEEEEKIKHRREHNKKSAKRSRDKKREENEQECMKLKELREENKTLRNQIAYLEMERDDYYTKLSNLDILEIHTDVAPGPAEEPAVQVQEISSTDLNSLIFSTEGTTFTIVMGEGN